MAKIIRTKTKANGGITEREKALMAEHSALWIKRAFRTDPIEPDKIIPAIEGLYASAGLKKPRVVIVPSPLVMAFAYGAAAAILQKSDEVTNRATREATRGAIIGATYEATGAATRARTYYATNRATNRATSARTSAMTIYATNRATARVTEAVVNATDDATMGATGAATDAATVKATDAATVKATDAATHDATYKATLRETIMATDAATRTATYVAAYKATSRAYVNGRIDSTRIAAAEAIADATYRATFAETFEATYRATYAAASISVHAAIIRGGSMATHDATQAATRRAIRPTVDATMGATGAATDAATSGTTKDGTLIATSLTISATRDATSDAIDMATADLEELAASVCRDLAGDLGIEYAKQWRSAYQGGNMWAGYDCYLTACRDILGLDLPEHAAYSHWEQATIHGGFRVMHRDFCLVCDFPEVIKIDENNRPHCEDGPSHRWRDGWSLYHWHGVSVPSHWIEDRKNLSPNEVLQAKNVEQRAAGISIIGMAKMLDHLPHKIIDSDPDPLKGDLIEITLDGLPETELYLKFECPRNGHMMEAINKRMLAKRDLHHAHAWHANVPARLFSFPQMRT